MIVASDLWPRAIFGDRLWGDKAVRFIFMDEAGISEEEPVTIVVGLIVDADNQMLTAEAAISEVLGAVPEKFREGFVFSAKDVWGNEKYREDWSMADRLGLLKRMMTLPRRLNIPLSMGLVYRTVAKPDVISERITRAQYHHFSAFAGCVAVSDRYIRDYAGMREIGTIVAEDIPEMQGLLRAATVVWRDNPLTLPPGGMRPTIEELKQGYMSQQGEFRVTRIRKTVHFVKKGDEAITQLADACAFGLRRYFSEQTFGTDFAEAIFVKPPLIENYKKAAGSQITFRWTQPTFSGTFGWNDL